MPRLPADLLEAGPRRPDTDHGEVHVVQQPRFCRAAYGGFYLAPPKAGSVGDVDLDDEVATVLADRTRTSPPTTVWLPDITQGRAIRDRRWSDM
jgi:hypothetical protein